MTTIAVIQARVGSSRLPGKVLAEVGGKPMLSFMLDRLRKLAVDAVVVATGTGEADDAVARTARACGVEVVRGPEHDVLARFREVLRSFPADTVIRLTADCPLIDASLVNSALNQWHSRELDYLSNTLLRTYPDGLDFEIVRATALVAAADRATDGSESEHVTPYLIRRPADYHLGSFHGTNDHADQRWTVDTPADLAFVRWVVAQAGDPADWLEVLSLRDRIMPRPEGVHLRPVRAASPVEELDRVGTRSWRAATDRHSIARFDLAVRDGAGTLRITCEPEAPIVALSASVLRLRTLLGSQVSSLEVPETPSEALTLALADCEFVPTGNSVSWHRSSAR